MLELDILRPLDPETILTGPLSLVQELLSVVEREGMLLVAGSLAPYSGSYNFIFLKRGWVTSSCFGLGLQSLFCSEMTSSGAQGQYWCQRSNWGHPSARQIFISVLFL